MVVYSLTVLESMSIDRKGKNRRDTVLEFTQGDDA